MLYLIGGPGRSGKTSLAMLLTRQYLIPFFSLDYLMIGLYHGATTLQVDPNEPEEQVTPRMWPVIRPLAMAMLENSEDYCLEGFALRPTYIAELAESFPETVRACCLGYATAQPKEKLRDERQYLTTNPWPADIDHDQALQEFVRFSQASIQLREECEKYRIGYFDTSASFKETIAKAAEYLTGYD